MNNTSFRDRIKGLQTVRASDLVPHPLNWRRHPESQRDALRGVLSEVGIVDVPICRELPDGRLQLLDGHLRQEVLGDTEISVLVLDIDDDTEAAKVLATLDPIAAMAEASTRELDQILRMVDTGSAAVQEMLAELADSAGLYQDEKKAAAASEDDDQELPIDPISRPGNMWALGPHRLLCGDSTDQAAVAAVLAGDPVAMQIMDPPFDKNYASWPLAGSPDIVMVWQRGIEALKWEAVSLASTYGCHELVFTGGVRGWPCDWFPCTIHDVVRMWRGPNAAKRFDASVLKASNCRTIEDGTRPFSVQEHAGGALTGYGGMSWGKALVAMEIAMSYVQPGAIVWDPCAGSGTSLIAAEKHGRIWRGCEMQPKWADLIIKRWEEFTGRKAELLSAAESGTASPAPHRE